MVVVFSGRGADDDCVCFSPSCFAGKHAEDNAWHIIDSLSFRRLRSSLSSLQDFFVGGGGSGPAAYMPSGVTTGGGEGGDGLGRGRGGGDTSESEGVKTIGRERKRKSKRKRIREKGRSARGDKSDQNHRADAGATV